jgi:hypothetical protein
MKKAVIIGSLLAAFCVVLVPVGVAIEYKTVEHALTHPVVENLSVQSIGKRFEDPQPTTIILLTMLILFLKFVRKIVNSLRISKIIFILLFLMILNNLP